MEKVIRARTRVERACLRLGSGLAHPGSAASVWLTGFSVIGLVAIVWCWRIVAATSGFHPLFNTDLFTYFYPMLEFGFRGDEAAGSVLWNPHQAFGVPTLATLQTGYLYPLHALYWFLPTAFCMGAQTFLHLVLGTLAATFLARTLRCTWPSALVAGTAFGFSYLLAAIYWPSVLEPMAWLPLGPASIERVVIRGDRRFLPVVSLAIGMPFLAGGYQHAVYGAIAAAIYAGLALAELGLARNAPLRAVIRCTTELVVAAGFGIALAAPQLLPTYELAQQTTRTTSALPLDQVLALGRLYPTPHALLDRLLVPPMRPTAGYVGAIPLLLALLAPFSPRGKRVLLFCGTAGAWAVLNMATPEWFLLAQAKVPPLSWFRIPERASVLLHLAVAIAAPLGTSALMNRDLDPKRRMLLTGLALLLCVSGSAWRYPRALWWLPPLLLPALWLQTAPLRRFAQCILVVALVVVDLTGATSNDLRLPYVDSGWRVSHHHGPDLDRLREKAGLQRVLLGSMYQPKLSWSPKTAMLQGIDSVFDYEPLASRRHADYLTFAAERRPWPDDEPVVFGGSVSEEVERGLIRRGRPFLSLMGVRFYAFPERPDPARLAELRVAGLRRLPAEAFGGEGSLVVFEDPGSLGRAYAVYGRECAAGPAEALGRLALRGFDPRAAVVLEDECEVLPPPRALKTPRVSIEHYTPIAVTIRAVLEQAGYVVLSDSYYPGWRARIDGQEAMVLRANGLVRAVPVPAGEHVVQFDYQPGSLELGLWIASATVVMGLSSLVRIRRDHGRSTLHALVQSDKRTGSSQP